MTGAPVIELGRADYHALIERLDWQPLRSSNVNSLAFDAADGSLYVRFGGKVYHYAAVPSETHEALLEAERDEHVSVGRAVHQLVKGQYPCTRLEMT